MSRNPDRNSRRAAAWAIIGACAGAGALLYLSRRRAAKQRQIEAAESPLNTSPQPGDILLFRNARGINKLITAFTGSPFYHVGLSAGGEGTVEALTLGVRAGSVRGWERDITVLPAPYDKGEAALTWAKTQIGDSYDDLDIPIIVVERLFRRIRINYTPANRFTCGEFVATAYLKAGVNLFPDLPVNDVVPADFARYLPDSDRNSGT